MLKTLALLLLLLLATPAMADDRCPENSITDFETVVAQNRAVTIWKFTGDAAAKWMAELNKTPPAQTADVVVLGTSRDFPGLGFAILFDHGCAVSGSFTKLPLEIFRAFMDKAGVKLSDGAEIQGGA